jgi:DNA (cytosine-5)-methyltransferase 1
MTDPARTLTHIDLFSGIGGFALAARWAGIQTVQFVEIDKFCQKVLAKQFPGVPIHDDIKTFTYAPTLKDDKRERGSMAETERCGESGDNAVSVGNQSSPFLLTGGFPCQPFSCAGKQRGTEDDRFLWPQVVRVIREFKPQHILLENVTGLFSVLEPDSLSELEIETIELFQQGDDEKLERRGIERIHRKIIARIISDIKESGYILPEDTEGRPIVLCLPACAVNAPHRRDRVWICAHSINGEHGTGSGQIRETDGLQGINSPSLCAGRIERTDCHATDTEIRERLPGYKDVTIINSGKAREIGSRDSWDEPWIEAATRLCRVDDGLSRQMDRVNRLKALGNAVVPQVAFVLMQGILEAENHGK